MTFVNIITRYYCVQLWHLWFISLCYYVGLRGCTFLSRFIGHEDPETYFTETERTRVVSILDQRKLRNPTASSHSLWPIFLFIYHSRCTRSWKQHHLANDRRVKLVRAMLLKCTLFLYKLLLFIMVLTWPGVILCCILCSVTLVELDLNYLIQL